MASPTRPLPLHPADNDIEPSPFLRLPPELRLQIYSLVLLPSQPSDLLPDYARVQLSAQDAFDYDKRQRGTDRLATTDLANPTLLIRTIDSTQHSALSRNETAAQQEQDQKPKQRRTVYSVRGDRFRARTMPTTYHCVNSARLAGRNAAALLSLNRQVHAEAAAVLYGGYTFDFDAHVEAVLPFLRDLSPLARAAIKGVRFVKRALPYEKEFDRAEWAAAVNGLASSEVGLRLRRLEVGVVAGRPGAMGWEGVQRYKEGDFGVLCEGEGMEWTAPLIELIKTMKGRGLKELEVAAVVEHCPPASNSGAMERFVRFSASVDDGFSAFLKGLLREDGSAALDG